MEFLTLLYLGMLRDQAVLAAAGFGSMTSFTMTSVCIGVAVGGAAQVSRALGAGDTPRFFVSVAVFNNLGYAIYATAIGWLRTTVGTLPFVWLGARYGGAQGVLLGQTLGFTLSSLLALALCLRVLRRPPAGVTSLPSAA